jgi:MFS transporter, OPA family, sugar phosphate sensor protein UhpC
VTLDADRARHFRTQVFVATWLSYAGFYVTRKVFSVVKGPIKESLHVDSLGVSHLWTIYLVAYMLGQFLSAWLSRRVSIRTQLLLGMTTSVLCNAALGVLFRMGPGAYSAIAVVMAVQGLAQATGWPCNVGLMAAWTNRAERGRVMAMWATCYQLGSIGAKGLAAYVFQTLGLSSAFFVSAGVLAIVVVIFWFFAHEKPEDRGLPPYDDSPVTASAATTSTGKNMATQQLVLVLAMGIIYFAFKFVRYALDSWSVLIMSEHFQLATDTAGYLSTVFDWIGFLGVLCAGFLSDRLSR